MFIQVLSIILLDILCDILSNILDLLYSVIVQFNNDLFDLNFSVTEL